MTRVQHLIATSVAPTVFALALNAHAAIVQIPATHLGESKTLRAQLFMPEKKSDAPRAAAILLHGCGGIGAKGALNPRHAMWKDWLVERGFIVVFPESFTSRGVEQICTVKINERNIQQRDRVADVLATHTWLASRGDVDARKIVLWGWSHGGGTVLAAITRERSGNALAPRSAASAPNRVSEFPRFAQAISFYPGCSSYANASASSSRNTLSAPLALFIGEADDWTPAAPCKTWVERLQEEKQAATITRYPGAFHDFDAPNGRYRVRAEVPNGVNPGRGVTVAPDPIARELAKKEIDLLLRAKKLVAP